MRFWLFFCLALVAFFVSIDGVETEAATMGCMNGTCHQELAEIKYMHGPVAAEMAGANGCKMCHVPAGVNCSAVNGGQFKVKVKGLCIACHAKGTGSQHSAKEIESKCLICHGPHGSDTNRYMLRNSSK